MILIKFVANDQAQRFLLNIQGGEEDYLVR